MATYITKVAFVESKLMFPLLHFVIPKKLLSWRWTVPSPLFGSLFSSIAEFKRGPYFLFVVSENWVKGLFPRGVLPYKRNKDRDANRRDLSECALSSIILNKE